VTIIFDPCWPPLLQQVLLWGLETGSPTRFLQSGLVGVLITGFELFHCGRNRRVNRWERRPNIRSSGQAVPGPPIAASIACRQRSVVRLRSIRRGHAGINHFDDAGVSTAFARLIRSTSDRASGAAVFSRIFPPARHRIKGVPACDRLELVLLSLREWQSVALVLVGHTQLSFARSARYAPWR